jgi:hypothetical protein
LVLRIRACVKEYETLTNNVLEEPSADPTRDFRCEKPSETPMEDPVVSDVVPELEPQGDDESDDEVEHDEEDALDEVAESMEAPAIIRSERIRGVTRNPPSMSCIQKCGKERTIMKLQMH